MFRFAKYVTVSHENTRLIAKCVMGFYSALKLVIRAVIFVYVWISLAYSFAEAWGGRIRFVLSVVSKERVRLRRFLRGAGVFFEQARTTSRNLCRLHAKTKLLVRSALGIYVRAFLMLRYVSLLPASTAFLTERAAASRRNVTRAYRRVSTLCSRNVVAIGLTWVLYFSINVLLENVYSLCVMTGTLLELYTSPNTEI
jgi:hypothetical protein